ncbi:ABC transporter substrate-binding protein [Hespellia stercorisuis]|uniref:Iron complex transport system substrate-binding protein n=1 Tax=Hespellia stercorisuis DSM 15480 TaxID=1121950 RepID=A0A1M6KI05_9FIRM|nr:ABC transporter substrate-binding protein [Hespellia stercorisuis]SHJ58593.1 iron complex transport system substrate-binding protein [Hespellia stercorisuis DSM 15480]
MRQFKKVILLVSILFAAIISTSCGKSQDAQWNSGDHDISTALSFDHSMDLKYATEFSIDYYDDGYILISISDGSRFLLNTEKKEVPEDLDSEIVVLDGTAQNIYLVASATMDMFHSIDALDHITLSGTKAENWYIEDAKAAMEDGRIQYAGKYNAPDYERILAENCGLAVESTMILHSPDVKEKLESFGIPVLVDHSSYESHPLGRTEWVKLYGALTGKEEAADAAFEEQEVRYQQLGDVEQTGKSVVFFYITSNETVVVRKPNDYVAKMIELAGGTYLFQDLGGEENASSSVNMQMEEFYTKAKDADYLVYNSTIEKAVVSMDELLTKSELLQDFKAVRDGNVWCTTQNVYQESMSTGRMIEEFHTMLTSEDTKENESKYMYQLQ